MAATDITCKYGACVFGNQKPRLIEDQGPAKSDIVIVSVAPGSMEFMHNTPIAGKPRTLLKAAFASVDISLDTVYITNVLKCAAAAPAQPSMLQLHNCRERLMHDIEARSPKKVLLLGRVATQVFFGHNASVIDFRGRPHKVKIGTIEPEVWVTQHPTAVMRNPSDVVDLFLDVRLMTNGLPTWRIPEVKVARNLADVQRFVTGIYEFAFDFETTGFLPQIGDILCLGLSTENRALVIPDEVLFGSGQEGIATELALLFYSGAYKPIGHNVKFDMQWLFQYFTKTLGMVPTPFKADDTMLMHHLLDERRGTHGLKLLASLYLGAPDYEASAKQYVGKNDSFARIPRPLLYNYCGTDCCATFRLFNYFEPMLREQGMEEFPYNALLKPGTCALALAEYYGIQVDLDYLHELDTQLSHECADLEKFLLEEYNLINPRSPQQVAVVMFDELKLPLWHRERKTPKECLIEYANIYAYNERVALFCRTMLEYRRRAKLLSTYVRGIEERLVNGRIHASWLLHGTVSGRASSRNPNLHNIPRTSPIKNLFIAAPENVFIHIDYNQVEFRVMAIMSQDQWLQEQFRAGRKFHDEVAIELYGPNFTKDQKIRAKAINFGIPYGRGAASIAEEHHMSVKEATNLLNTWFARMPQMREWIDSVHNQVFNNGGVLQTPFGRKRRFLLITDFNRKDVSHESVAFLPQSTASDITLWALGSLWQPLLDYDARIVNWIHDALLIECPKANVDAVTALAKEIMTSLPESKFNFPFPVDAEVGDRWGNLVSEDNE